jgi:alpha-L-rhamnosidase
MHLKHLRVEQLSAPLGLWTSRPRFSWILPEGVGAQSAYELVIEDPDGSAWTSGRVESAESVLVEAAGFEAASRTAYAWRVRVWADGAAEPTEWAESTFETSILDPAEWQAQWVEPEQESVRPDGAQNFAELFSLRIATPPEERLLPTPYVRQRFEVDGVPVRARVYATAHGIYQAELNGHPLGDQVFAPGVETYGASLSFQTYDATAAVRAGSNVFGMVLSDGWYAGRVGILGSSRGYGDRLRALWQLHVETEDGRIHVFFSDGSARSSTRGPIRYADLAVGEGYDARIDWTGWSTPAFDDGDWDPVTIARAEQPLVPFEGEPVRRVLELPAVAILRTPADETVVDFGQVIAGRVRFRVDGERGRVVSLQHSEVLDSDGNFFMNILGPNKDQTDVYTLAGLRGGEVWEPTFTFHGFRYVRLTGFPDDISESDFTAIVTGSDLRMTGNFRCSDDRLTRLHENAVWSQRGNFLSIPTDCPQRERYGWTGDLQIFAPTAATNMGVGPFLSRWLRIVRGDQLLDGRIVNISPIPPQLDFLMQAPPPSYDDPILLLASSAGWGDAIAIVPQVLYERYGDRRVLAENYPAMVAWVEYQIRSAAEGPPPRLAGVELSAAQRERQQYLWNTVPHFGDWLAPSTLRGPDGSQMNAPRRTGEVVGCLFHGRTLEIVAQVAEVLGHEADAARYRDRAQKVWAAVAEEYIGDDGRIFGDMQGPSVLALAFGAVPERLRDAVVDRLVELIHEAGDHLDTGFVSVPFLLDVLWTHGHRELALTLLWQDTAPSWLYEVDRGATTMWEGWEAIRPDGVVTDLSFNHYAFGCVDDWMYRRLGGLQATAPGFRRSRIEPAFTCGLADVSAAIETPYGELRCEWSRRGDRVEVEVHVPANTTSTLVLPAAGEVPVRPGTSRFTLTLTDIDALDTPIRDPGFPDMSNSSND